jgi:archaemetzincin
MYIRLISLGAFDPQLLDTMSSEVANAFSMKTTSKQLHVDLQPYFNSSRKQYDANQLLQYIDQEIKDDQSKTLALVNVDLFIPILTYIFGQAYLGGNTAIASLYRLQNELYGLKKNEKLLKERLLKEIVHELGHSFGLIHCRTTGCVMQSSTYVEDIDQKEHHFCPQCKNKIAE